MATAEAPSQGQGRPGACRRPGAPTCDPACSAHALIFNDANKRFRDAGEADAAVRNLEPDVCVCCGGVARDGLAIRDEHYTWATAHRHWRFCDRECVAAVTRVLEGGQYPNRVQNCLTYIEAQEHARREAGAGAGAGTGAGAGEPGVVSCVKCNARCRERTFDQHGRRKTSVNKGFDDYELVSRRTLPPQPASPTTFAHHPLRPPPCSPSTHPSHPPPLSPSPPLL